MRTWIDVAYLAKTRNSKGRFAARAAAGLPFLLEPGDEVAFVPPQTDVPRSACVKEVRLIDDVSADIEFEGVATMELAQQMIGMHCLIRRELVDEDVFRASPGTWEGWRVVDSLAGEVGTVSGLVENPAQMLLEVLRPDGATALVPAVEEIIREVDIETGTIYVDLPKGLLDL